MDDTFTIAYFAVFTIVAIGSWLFSRSLSPARMHYWQPRMTIAVVAILGPFFVWVPLHNGQIEGVVIVTLALAFIGYINVTKVRVCLSCGKVSPPKNFLDSAKFCPQCGAALTPPTLFGPPNE